MAKLKGGILGKVTGSVGNIVTASWKGINYARDRVIPANPQSVGQMKVRNNMTNLVLLGRSIKSVFIDTYWENLVRGTANSGWAKFIGTNQKATYENGNLQDVKLASGDLEGAANLSVVVSEPLEEVQFSFDATSVSNGSATDVVYAEVFVPERNFVYSQSSPVQRNGVSVSCTVPDVGSIVGSYYAYLTLKKSDGTKFSTTQGVKLP